MIKFPQKIVCTFTLAFEAHHNFYLHLCHVRGADNKIIGEGKTSEKGK
jgi:hypothetical protein